MQVLLTQSAPIRQAFPTAQSPGQSTPPQSVSVSDPFFTPSGQLRQCQLSQ